MPYAVFTICKLAAIDRATRKKRSQFSKSDAEHLMMHDMQDAFLPIRYNSRKTDIQSFYYLTQKDATLGKRVKKACLGIAEK